MEFEFKEDNNTAGSFEFLGIYQSTRDFQTGYNGFLGFAPYSGMSVKNDSFLYQLI